MPAALLTGERSNMAIDSLLNSAARRHILAPHAPRHVLGFGLPDWQRPAVWTQAQQIRFVESAWLGFSLGEIVITRGYSDEALDNHVIDGQQRLTALEAYVNDAFPVFGARYSELAPRYRDWFGFSVGIGVMWIGHGLTEATLKELYVRMNYGGTPHAPEHHPDAHT